MNPEVVQELSKHLIEAHGIPPHIAFNEGYGRLSIIHREAHAHPCAPCGGTGKTTCTACGGTGAEHE